jgi:hypothetical protein
MTIGRLFEKPIALAALIVLFVTTLTAALIVHSTAHRHPGGCCMRGK